MRARRDGLNAERAEHAEAFKEDPGNLRDLGELRVKSVSAPSLVRWRMLMPRDRTIIGAAAVVAALLIPGLPSPVTVPVGSGAVRAQSQHDGAIVPFKIAVPDAVLTDLKERLARTRFPSEIEGSGWDYGTNLAYLRELVTYWRTRFDWREQERRLNEMPQFTTSIDGIDLHFVHQRSSRSDAIPLVFIHGWPGSIVEVTKI